ncbi:iron donor protein CyaY [Anncaliia algerae PRA109]|nr:iron donor protein CyaY [Anncaliia algerae PRA109]
MEKCNFNDSIKETLIKLYEKLFKSPFTSDIDLNNNVLTWKVANIGDYVFNKQSPTKQLWISSPISGPIKFDFVDCKFYNKKSDLFFKKYIRNEISSIKLRHNEK